MGGKALFRQRLIYALHQKAAEHEKLVDFGNEPSFQTIWLFDALDRPYLASYWANQLKHMYVGVRMPGDEDNGAMSSLFCFLDLGIFPMAGQDLYYLHGGSFPRVSFQLANGKTFTIVNTNASADNIYVQSATLNGQPLDNPALHHADILNGGTLEFVMGPQPSSWGCAGEFDAVRAADEIKPIK
jgi:putative alpha-1,2-mannosidase